MIFDGKWKWELKKLSWEIVIWKRLPILDNLAKHRLNRAILYSAIILRKIIEDEVEAESIAKKCKIPLVEQKTVHTSIKAIKCPYIGEDGWAIRNKFFVSDYGNGQNVYVKIKDVCNWLLHSYVWAVAHNTKQKTFAGFLVSSDFDKEKFVHYISFDQWKKVIDYVIENAAF